MIGVGRFQAQFPRVGFYSGPCSGSGPDLILLSVFTESIGVKGYAGVGV